MLRYFCTASLILALASCGAGKGRIDTSPLPAIAPGTDYGKGVSAAAAGEIAGTLVIAGGANFPDTPAAEGGKKRFYDEIFTLEPGASQWRFAGSLPQPVAYGATFALDDCIIVAGGANADGSLADVCKVTLNKCTVTPMSPLPIPVEQAASARNGEKLYIAGGVTDGTASLGVYACDLADDGAWRIIAELPEPFVQPVAAATERYLYVWGGFDPTEKCAADYGYRYDLRERAWSPIAGLPDGGTAVGSTAVQQGNGTMWLVGGVNREIFNAALNMPADRNGEYLSHPAEWYRFRSCIMKFDPQSESWETVGEFPASARAGAALAVSEQSGLTILNGEEKPGIRSAENNVLKIL